MQRYLSSIHSYAWLHPEGLAGQKRSSSDLFLVSRNVAVPDDGWLKSRNEVSQNASATEGNATLAEVRLCGASIARVVSLAMAAKPQECGARKGNKRLNLSILPHISAWGNAIFHPVDKTGGGPRWRYELINCTPTKFNTDNCFYALETELCLSVKCCGQLSVSGTIMLNYSTVHSYTIRRWRRYWSLSPTNTLVVLSPPHWHLD